MSYDTAYAAEEFQNRCDLIAKDVVIFNRKNSTISFRRGKNNLRYNTSRSKDFFRHANFVRSEDDFNEFAQLISKIYGLSGRRINGNNHLLLWEFTGLSLENVQIFYGATIAYNPQISMITVFSASNHNDSIGMIVNFLKSENDFFELANLIASANGCLCREIEEVPNSKACYIDLIPS